MYGDRYMEELIFFTLVIFGGLVFTLLGHWFWSFFLWVGGALSLVGGLGFLFYSYKRSRP
jgi:hypothetical protein